MIEFFNLYLPKSKREIRLAVSSPSNKESLVLDTMYLLDGQNAFKDSLSAFGRSIRATETFHHTSTHLQKHILGVAIYNSGSDLGRMNEYSPFPMENPTRIYNKNNDINVCHALCEDIVHTIVPFIDKKYKTTKNRFIYGSSLAAVTALVLGISYPEIFSYIGAFSTASFLFENHFYSFLDAHSMKDKNIFLYVGRYETSDTFQDINQYYTSSLTLYEYLKKNKTNTRLLVDLQGQHNEATWDKHLFDFISFIYSKNILYTI